MTAPTRRLAIAVVLIAVSRAGAQPFDCDGVPVAVGEDITLELVVSGLTDPVDVTHAPDDASRLFIVEQNGRIRILDLATDALLATPFLDIRSRVNFGGERGLLGLAFHPHYAENGEFFVNYSRLSDGATVVARYRVSDANPNVASSASESIVLTVAQPFSNHNGGQLAFSPRDEKLYIGMGDGGSGGDPQNNGQTRSSLLAKMLRIDVDSAAPYGVPADNPFVGTASVRGEIWAFGVRNPWRFSFDPLTYDLWIADVGQGDYEEIDVQPADSTGGENYEWRVLEGLHSYDGGTAFGPGTRQGPVYEYDHSVGRSITGGAIYRGCAIPDLSGRYFFADYENDWVRSFRLEGGSAVDVVNHTTALNAGIAGSIDHPTAFGIDARGEIYLVDHQVRTTTTDGRLYRIVSSNPPNTPPTARITTDPPSAVLELAGASVQILLDGTTSDDGDGGVQELTYAWEKLSGPGGDAIGRPTKETTLVTFTAAGEYVYELTVGDGAATDRAETTVLVNESAGVRFRRGDANVDGITDISDGTFVLGTLFLGFAPRGCDDAMDTNDSGDVDVSDAVALFGYLFTGGVAPPPPGATSCGLDTTDDGLDCELYAVCG